MPDEHENQENGNENDDEQNDLFVPPAQIDEEEIPPILEYKLDVIMHQLNNLGGGAPNPKVRVHASTMTQPTGEEEVDQPIPDGPGIPKILEIKLDHLIMTLRRVRDHLGGLNMVFGKNGQLVCKCDIDLTPLLIPLWWIVFLLIIANVTLMNMANLLTLMSAILLGIFLLVAFVVVQVVVPFLIRQRRQN